MPWSGLKLSSSSRSTAENRDRNSGTDIAIEKLRGSKAAREILGDAFVDHYVRTRDWECREYNRSVGEWELRRYFEGV